MENNWRETTIELIKTYRNLFPYDGKASQQIADNVLTDAILNQMNLVFEATKRECADKAESYSQLEWVS